MIDKETLFKAIDSIDEDLVDEAAEYRFADRSFIPRLLAAAAVLILGGAIFAATKLVNKPAPEQSAALPTEAAETPVPTPDISSMRIVNGSGEDCPSLNSVQDKGTVRLMGTLPEALSSEETSNCLFDVKIVFLYIGSAEIDQLAKKYQKECVQAESDPAYVEFIEGELVWLEENGRNFTPEEANLWETRGLEGFTERYLSEISGSIPQSKAEEYREAIKKVEKARYYVREGLTDIINRSDEMRRAVVAEAERLEANGLWIDIGSIEYDGNSWHCSALLTKEQIECFPADPELAYKLYFSNEYLFASGTY
ncbi:MAG: hypothetical protein IKG85_00620 [Clostridia bacterium]|nr:hypothetical protein [Clostridia bacterium]